jgi:multiple sugar transport system substrate-binding protein
MQRIQEEFQRGRGPDASTELSFFPDTEYSEKIAVAAAAHDLPDVLEIDGPLVSKFVTAHLLRPLDGFVSGEVKSDFLPTVIEQGTIGGRLYALGAFESALVVYYDRSMLARAHVEAPLSGESWSWDRFLEAARALKASDVVPVALHMSESADEWFVYAFAPILWSAGGDLISEDGKVVKGVLDSRENAEALERWQVLFIEGLALADPVDPDPFGSGRAAMDWNGHWMARAHLSAKSDLLGAMPIPRMGALDRASSGSWCWAVTSSTDQEGIAFSWIARVIDPRDGMRMIVEANGAVPARRSAFPLIPWLDRAPFSLFRSEIQSSARPRPRTPYYPTLARAFASMLRDIAHGASVPQRLQEAAVVIQRDIDRKEPH